MAENEKIKSDESLTDILNSEKFTNLSEASQELIINTYNNKQEKSGGLIGKLLGTNTKNITVHMAFILCCIMLAFCGIDLIHSVLAGEGIQKEMWNFIIPVITSALGYVFGKGDK